MLQAQHIWGDAAQADLTRETGPMISLHVNSLLTIDSWCGDRYEVRHVSGGGQRSPPRGGFDPAAENQQLLVDEPNEEVVLPAASGTTLHLGDIFVHCKWQNSSVRMLHVDKLRTL